MEQINRINFPGSSPTSAGGEGISVGDGGCECAMNQDLLPTREAANSAPGQWKQEAKRRFMLKRGGYRTFAHSHGVPPRM